jgi:hypothetical protein
MSPSEEKGEEAVVVVGAAGKEEGLGTKELETVVIKERILSVVRFSPGDPGRAPSVGFDGGP